MQQRCSSGQEFAAGRCGPASLPPEYGRDFDALLPPPGSCYRVALLVPLCGAAGIWSPSCIASAQVAVNELNRRDGIDGRQVQLLLVDAAEEAAVPVDSLVSDLLQAQAIDAIVGMHISAVRQRLSKVVRQRVPFIYTPLYEGGERTPGVIAIGETPALQLGPAIGHLHSTYRFRRWAMIGNDYVWPRASHTFAKRILRNCAAPLVYERYLPFGVADMRPFVDEIRRCRADAVLVSLIGQDAVMFNRAFGDADLHRSTVRFSCAVEENVLLASGPKSLNRFYASAAYFGSLRTEANASFREKYHSTHGDHAPVLNTLGQSTYEGIHCLAALVDTHGDDWRSRAANFAARGHYRSARRLARGTTEPRPLPTYLARVTGMEFEIVKNLTRQ